MNYYEFLGVSPDCDFKALKKAYWKRAKECHPDHFQNDPRKTEEFKKLVNVFNVLSDPEARARYDCTLNISTEYTRNIPVRRGGAIMDTEADDTLEELIVGNDVPLDATLMTLMLDLQRTEIFLMWREAEDLFLRKKYPEALVLFEKLVRNAPGNILYHVYFARCLAKFGKKAKAIRQYSLALEIGARRDPPQRMASIRIERETFIRKNRPWYAGFLKFFEAPIRRNELPADDEMLEETNRVICGMLGHDRNQDRKALPPGAAEEE